MGRSQRHMLDNYGATAAGEVHAQGEIADSILAQAEVTTPAIGVLEGAEGWVVPEGPPGGPLQGSTMIGAIPDDAPPPPNPEPGVTPTLESIDPATSPVGGPDITCTITGTGFSNDTVLVWNGADDHAAYVNETTMTTVVKASLAEIPITVPLAVRNGDLMSNELEFTFTEAVEPEAAAPEADGPYEIAKVLDDEDGFAIHITGDLGIAAGDTIVVEATGNTSVNGEYQVADVGEDETDTIVYVLSNYVLEAPIEGKGRLTITATA